MDECSKMITDVITLLHPQGKHHKLGITFPVFFFF